MDFMGKSRLQKSKKTKSTLNCDVIFLAMHLLFLPRAILHLNEHIFSPF